MRIKIKEIIDQTGLTKAKLGEQIWPESSPGSRRVMLAKWQRNENVTIRLEQLKTLCDIMATTNVRNIVEWEDTE